VFCLGGARNLYCNWVQFFIELGFNFPTTYFKFVCVVVLLLFLEIQAVVVSFFLSNIVGNLICISFVAYLPCFEN
jgi:hypothetical protein